MKLVILGRDGVINQVAPEGICHADQWQPLPGSAEAIARLSQAGYRVVVITNQQGLSSGDLTIEALHDIHEKMMSVIAEAGGVIDSIFFAATGDPNGRGKRQPKVKLLNQIENRYGITMKDVTLIGDAREDLDAATAVGARPVLVRTGQGTEMLGELTGFDGVIIYADLASAVDALLAG
jgi:D-glycero-D-manno-heptose 1,7-bisphosphate phosphatase